MNLAHHIRQNCQRAEKYNSSLISRLLQTPVFIIPETWGEIVSSLETREHQNLGIISQYLRILGFPLFLPYMSSLFLEFVFSLRHHLLTVMSINQLSALRKLRWLYHKKYLVGFLSHFLTVGLSLHFWLFQYFVRISRQHFPDAAAQPLELERR